MTGQPKIYYADGYHGGVEGHMPFGCLRDILNEMERKPYWKLSLELEPFSWKFVRSRDPEAFSRLKTYLQDQSPKGRVEMVSAAYSQAYCWCVGGESNIRQLTLGRKELRKYFPEAVIDTYAVQEPCWTSCLPQILRSLGYRRASLKNPSTAWGGYTVGKNASVLNWIGPDGSAIPTVPRYACEELLNAWETESCNATLEFTQKCIRNGVEKPAGMYYQDAGWKARPRVAGDHVQFVTWREFFETIAGAPEMDWRFSQEDIRVALVWGYGMLQRLAQSVRSAENRVVAAEKMASLAAVWKGFPYPAEGFEEAWAELLLAQHHDAWIVPLARKPRGYWAEMGAWQAWTCERFCQDVIREAGEVLADSRQLCVQQPLEIQAVRLYNTLGVPRGEVAEVPFTADRGVVGVRVFDLDGNELPSQVIISRRYDDDKNQADEEFQPHIPAQEKWINAGKVLFPANVPAMGYQTYLLQSAAEPIPNPTSVVKTEWKGNLLYITSDCYRICLDAARGGVIASLVSVDSGVEFAAGDAGVAFNEIRGYFPSQGSFFSTADQPAEIEILENGPLQARLAIHSSLHALPILIEMIVTQGQRRIDFTVSFEFPSDTWIGEGWGDQEPMYERRRPCYDDRYKLQACFPTPFGKSRLYKNAAYDVCLSQNENTYFNAWDQIKHNILLDWVDLESKEGSLALFCDHTTSYIYGSDHPLSLVLGYSGKGLWGFNYAFDRRQTIHYALLPHSGGWNTCLLSLELAKWKEPLYAQLMTRQPPADDSRRSLLWIDNPRVEVPTMQIEGDALLVRLFNASDREEEVTIGIGIPPDAACLVELEGQMREELTIRRAEDGSSAIALRLPPFAIRTLKLTGLLRS